jgi:hypothetical protein
LLGAAADLLRGTTTAAAYVFDCLLHALAEAPCRLTGVAEHLPGPAADPLAGSSEAPQELRVPIQRRQHALQDRGHVAEPGLEQSLGLDALDPQLDLAQVDVRPDAELHEVTDLGQDRYLRAKLIHLDLDLVDFDLGHVDEDVRSFGDLAGIDD